MGGKRPEKEDSHRQTAAEGARALDLIPLPPESGQVKRFRPARLVWVALGASLMTPASGFAQKAVIVDDDGKPALVRAAEGAKPMVERNGKLEFSGGLRFALRDAPAYFPYIVKVTVDVGTASASLNGSTARINNRLNLGGTLESPIPLERVFVALDLDMDMGKSFVLWGIGTLRPGEPTRFSVSMPTSFDMGSGRYQFHVFSDGAELLNTMMDSGFIQAQLEALVRKKIEGVQNEKLGVLLHPSPIFPADLKKKNVKGSAVVTVRINQLGYVIEASVKSATEAAFGEAALVAVRQWQFLPPIKDGRPSGLSFDVPINFN
jgi:TonB family protein